MLGLAPAANDAHGAAALRGIDIGGETVWFDYIYAHDGVQMADEAIASVRKMIGTEFGKEYVPGAPRRYQAKAKNAQEAHEAIRRRHVAAAAGGGTLSRSRQARLI